MLKKPKEQLLEMVVGGMRVTFAVDLSSLPPTEGPTSLPIRVAVAAEKPFRVESIHIPPAHEAGEWTFKERTSPELDSKRPLSGHSLTEDYMACQYGARHPSIIFVGGEVYTKMASLPGFCGTFQDADVIRLISLPPLLAIFLNANFPTDPKCNKIVEYANA